MNKPKKNVPGFVVFILYVFLGKREKVDIPRLIRLNGHILGLFTHKEVIILINYP